MVILYIPFSRCYETLIVNNWVNLGWIQTSNLNMLLSMVKCTNQQVFVCRVSKIGNDNDIVIY